MLLKELWESKFFIYFITFLFVFCLHLYVHGFHHKSVGKESTHSAGHPSLIPGLGRSAGEGIGYPVQYSGLENSKDCIVHGVEELDTTEQLALALSYLHDISIISSFLITTMGHLFPTTQRPKGMCINQGCGWKQRKLSEDVLGKKVHNGKLWDAHTMDWQLKDQTLKTCHKGTIEAPIQDVNQLSCRRKRKAAVSLSWDQILCPPGDPWTHHD